jgi:hypothetical protein
VKVNNIDANPGCYAEGHRGQYGIDRIAEICEEFDIPFDWTDDPRYWRRVAEGEQPSDVSPENARDRHVWAGERLEELLNEHTEGGYWSWEDGEFFLFQTEVEGIVFVRVEPGEDYDDAWRLLVDHGIEAAVTSYDQIETGERAYQFKITVHYEPDDA